METSTQTFEYTNITYDPNDEEEEKKVNAIMDNPEIEFVARRPRRGMLVLTVRKEIYS